MRFIALFFLILTFFIVGCSLSPQQTQQVQQLDQEVAAYEAVHQTLPDDQILSYDTAAAKLNVMFASGKKWKCEFLTDSQKDEKNSQVFYLDGETYRGEGTIHNYLHPELDGSSYVLGKREGTRYCSYMWVSKPQGKQTDASMWKACLDNFHDVHPFQVGELGVAQFEGVTEKVLSNCQEYTGVIDLSAPENIPTADWSDLGKLAAAMNQTA